MALYGSNGIQDILGYLKTYLAQKFREKANTRHTHSKSDITDFPQSMPASDVYSWAKESNKPSYTWNEIYNKPSSFTPSGHTHPKSDIADFPSSMPASDVPDWAKDPSKPTYTASEVGAAPAGWTYRGSRFGTDTFTISQTGVHEILLMTDVGSVGHDRILDTQVIPVYLQGGDSLDVYNQGLTAASDLQESDIYAIQILKTNGNFEFTPGPKLGSSDIYFVFTR